MKVTKCVSTANAQTQDCTYFEYKCNEGRLPKTRRRTNRGLVHVPPPHAPPPGGKDVESNRIDISPACATCYEQMGRDVITPSEGEGETKEIDLFSLVKIMTPRHNTSEVGENELKKIFLETTNGYIKAELLGCNFHGPPKQRVRDDSIKVHSAYFESINFYGDDATSGKYRSSVKATIVMMLQYSAIIIFTADIVSMPFKPSN